MEAVVSLSLALPTPCNGEAPPQESLERVLAFESGTLDDWSGGPRETLSLDSAVTHQGGYAGRIDRGAGSAGRFSSFTLSIPRTFAGDTVALRGWLRTESVSGFAGLWLRQDGRAGMLHFDNMESRQLSGTTAWTEYAVTLPLDERTRTIVVGALLLGEGTVWADDLELLVDGGPVAEAPPFELVRSPIELDTEFDAGSGIAARALSATEVERLALLGRVWGFVKYHHPRVRRGEVDWDYELFRVVPDVLEAADHEAAKDEIERWLARLGEPDPCGPCASPPPEPHLLPDIGWIRNGALLGEALSERLRLIHERRPASDEHHYVSLAEGVGNPVFAAESDYAEPPLPDAGYRLLALYRFWSIIEYWFPYRDLIDGAWEEVLVEFLPQVMRPLSVEEYRLTMIRLSARIEDTHANVWSQLDLRPPGGTSALPVVVRFVEGRAVVTGYSDPDLGPATGLEVGDVILEIDGGPVDSLVASWRPYYSASNEPARLGDIARSLTRGEPRPVRVSGVRARGEFSISADRVPAARLDRGAGRTHDLPGPAFQRLGDDVAYLKLSSARAADVARYLEGATGADVLVVDIRNYPSEFVVFALGGHLVTEPTPFARFTRADPMNPGAFSWGAPVSLQPLEPHFSGAVVILVDEVSLSQAEYTAMALRAAPNAIVVGSTTAGADGNVSPIPLPGGISSMISGIGVFYADREPTQQVGIVPDLEVRPTIAGIRTGRDEVLEAAVTRVLGTTFRLEIRGRAR